MPTNRNRLQITNGTTRDPNREQLRRERPVRQGRRALPNSTVFTWERGQERYLRVVDEKIREIDETVTLIRNWVEGQSNTDPDILRIQKRLDGIEERLAAAGL